MDIFVGYFDELDFEIIEIPNGEEITVEGDDDQTCRLVL
jgi:hypothetical protein